MTSFTVNGISAEVREMRGADLLRQDVIRWRLENAGLADEAVYIKNAFAVCVLCTESISGLAFEWPKHTANPEVLLRAFQAWDKLPTAVISAWTDAIESASSAPNDPATVPGADQKN